MLGALQAILAPLLAAGGAFGNGLVAVLVAGLCLCPCCAAICLAFDAANATTWAVANSPKLVAGAQASSSRAVSFAGKLAHATTSTAPTRASVAPAVSLHIVPQLPVLAPQATTAAVTGTVVAVTHGALPGFGAIATRLVPLGH
jgi:hypothetical protein